MSPIVSIVAALYTAQFTVSLLRLILPKDLVRAESGELIGADSFFLSLGCTALLWITGIAVYVFKSKLSPPLCRDVARLGFYPMLPITIINNFTRGGWYGEVIPGIFLGSVPLVKVFNLPEVLFKKHNVRGVLNLMDEYEGPLAEYERLGMNHLRIPTVDHQDIEPEHLLLAMRFIRMHREQNEAVYIHCKAGHGRGATTTFAWMVYEGFANGDSEAIQARIAQVRRVRTTILARSKSLQLLYGRLKRKIIDHDDSFNEDQRQNKNVMCKSQGNQQDSTYNLSRSVDVVSALSKYDLQHDACKQK